MRRWASRIALAGALLALAALAATFAIEGGDARAGDRGWTTLRHSPLSRTEVGAARIGDRIYVVGGFVSPGKGTARVARYDISANRWRLVAPAPVAVNHPGVASLDGRLYLAGGIEDSGLSSDGLYSYDPESNRWRTLAEMPTARGALVLVARQAKLYAIGGVNGSGDDLRALEIYDVGRDRWRSAAPMPTGRNHLAGVAFQGAIWAIGGRVGGSGISAVERYSPRSGAWSAAPSLSLPRSGHAAVVAGGEIVAFGGEELVTGGHTIAPVDAFRPGRGWSTAELPPMRTPRHGLGGAAAGHRVFALEGGPRPGYSFSNALESLRVP